MVIIKKISPIWFFTDTDFPHGVDWNNYVQLVQLFADTRLPSLALRALPPKGELLFYPESKFSPWGEYVSLE